MLKINNLRDQFFHCYGGSLKKVAVGSQNPVKIEAVKEVTKDLFDEIEVLSIDAPSKVSEMPFGEEEAIKGAENRAKYCLDNTDADLCFGLEGYVTDNYTEKMYLSGWSVVMDREGTVGRGSGGRIQIPEYIAQHLREGEELGPLIDDILDETGIKKDIGTIGVLTDGKVPRKDTFKRAVCYSLSKHIKPDFY